MRFRVRDSLRYGKAAAIASNPLAEALGFRSVRDLQKQIERERASGAVRLMALSSLWESQIGCPFYRSDEKRKIVCEGVGEAEAIVLRFRYTQERNKQIRLFCGGCYERCEIFRMVSEKYDD